jgi:hypothetical protein
MDVEKDDIQKSWQEYQAHCPSQKVFESVALKQMITLVKMCQKMASSYGLNKQLT